MKTTNQKIKKYVYNLFGLNITVDIQHHFYNRAGAKAYPKEKKMIFSLVALKQNPFPRYLIWHEVGHLITSKSPIFCVENEVMAQLWAIKETKRRGYHNLMKDFINYTKGWGTNSVNSNSIIYSIAKYKILRELKIK